MKTSENEYAHLSVGTVLQIFITVCSIGTLLSHSFQIEKVYSDYLALYNKRMLTSVNHRELFQEALQRNGLESLVSDVVLIAHVQFISILKQTLL